MRRGLIAMGVLGAIVATAWWIATRPDSNGDPGRTLPPPLLAETAGKVVLFDGRTAVDWRFEGPRHVGFGTIALGGSEPSTGAVDRTLGEGEALEFDFFQEGAGGATLRLKPVLLAPQPPDPEFLHDIEYDLTLEGFAYKRWHHVTVRAARDGGNTRVSIDIEAYRGGPGRGGRAVHSLPARGGCRYELRFEAGRDSFLSLRNVFIQPAQQSP